MDLKNYLVNYILTLDNNKYSKLELYTKTCVQLSTIKDYLHSLDNIKVNADYCTAI